MNPVTDMQFSIPEHVVAFDFSDDDLALQFLDWWYETGQASYLLYKKEKEN